MDTGPIRNSYWVLSGRLAAGEYPGDWSPGVARSKLRQLLMNGIQVFIDLTEQGELKPYDQILEQEAAAIGGQVEYHRMPIRDLSVPSPEGMRQIQRTITAALAADGGVYVHCWGGVGRTGTVVGCYLVGTGMSGQAALQRLSLLWQGVEKHARVPRTPETPEQKLFVLSWKAEES
jgi:hypothetical protein